LFSSVIPAVLLTWQYKLSSDMGHFSTLLDPELLINAALPPEINAPVAAPATAPDAVPDDVSVFVPDALPLLPPLKDSKNIFACSIIYIYSIILKY
jgi:hypothetical protein